MHTIVPAAALAACVMFGSAAMAAEGPPAPQPQAQPHEEGAAPAASFKRDAAGRPDLSGVWRRRPGRVLTIEGEPIPFQPWAQKIFDDTVKTAETDKPFVTNREYCLPQGMDAMFNAYMIQFAQMPDKLYILSEWGNEVRHVYMDEPQQTNPKPSWNGSSVGHWEGDTLVVDTVGFNDKTQLTTLADRGRTNTMHSTALHVVERFTLSPDGKTMLNTMTIEDPNVFTKPWTTVLTSEARPDTQVFEFVCADAPLDLKG